MTKAEGYSVSMYLVHLFAGDFLSLLESILDKGVICLVGQFHLYIGNEISIFLQITKCPRTI